MENIPLERESRRDNSVCELRYLSAELDLLPLRFKEGDLVLSREVNFMLGMNDVICQNDVRS